MIDMGGGVEEKRNGGEGLMKVTTICMANPAHWIDIITLVEKIK